MTSDAPDAGEPARKAAAQLEDILAEVRSLPGLERFFQPPRVQDLTPAAQDGPVVVLNLAPTRCDALIVSSSDVQTLALPQLEFEEAYEQVNAFVQATDTVYDADAPAAAQSEAGAVMGQVLSWLWDAVTEPVLSYLGYTQARMDTDFESWPRLWWVPTGPLAFLPMHAAGHHNPSLAAGRSVARDRTVLDRVVSSTAPTVRSLVHARQRPAPDPDHRKALLVGMPHTPSTGEPIGDLPGTVEELARITTIIGPEHRRVLDGDPKQGPAARVPTRTSVLAALPDHAWAHFACHGHNNPDEPDDSRLLLWDHETDPLTVRDLIDSPLRHAQLAYLSACTTARTGPRALDEPIHFAAAALLAGYRHAIATLWPIPDEAETADTIYTTLTTTTPTDWTAPQAAVAVHHAIHQRRNTHPSGIHTWAPHTHHGP